jgi:hypothetical protein
MDAGLADILFWGTLAFSFAVAFVVTLPVNRALIRRGKGHAVVHSHITGVREPVKPQLNRGSSTQVEK